MEGSRALLQFALDFIRILNVEAIERDLPTIGYLTDGHKRDIELIREAQSMSLNNLSPEQIYPTFLKLSEGIAILQELRAEILEGLCYGIFKDYLPSIEENPSFAPGLRPASPK